MISRTLLSGIRRLVLCLGIASVASSAGLLPAAITTPAGPRSFPARGTVLELRSDGTTVVIRHQAISNYMAAMTMPFRVKNSRELAGLHRGDEITFQLQVTETESWIDHVVRTGSTVLPAAAPEVQPPAPPSGPALLDYRFTNELGQAVSLNDFHGQALAITFFYTRCPLPDYCPRLSKNFQMAQQKIESLTGVPSNWHLISVSFDPEFDTPATLKTYGNSYQYDPNHWSFLTGPADKIGELARACDVSYQPSAGTINHNFRTLIIDPAGHLQTMFPTSGDLSDQIVSELLKAMASTNSPTRTNARAQNP